MSRTRSFIKKTTMKTNRTQQQKSVNDSAKLNFNSYTDTNTSDDGKTNNYIKHQVLDDNMVLFGNITSQYLQCFILNRN